MDGRGMRMNLMAEIGETTHPATQRGSMRRFLPRGTQAACLVHISPSGSDMGRRYPLANRIVTLGRGDSCDIRITDQSVSRTHARVTGAGDGYEVADLQSTNGTFVNDAAVIVYRLKDGDYVRVGNC